MPDAVWSVNRSLPNLSRANDYLPVLTSFLRFRHFVSGSLSLISLIHTWSFSQDLFLNAHHNGSLPMQLKVVWNQCLYIDFGRPLLINSSPISCAASWHTIISVANKSTTICFEVFVQLVEHNVRQQWTQRASLWHSFSALVQPPFY